MVVTNSAEEQRMWVKSLQLQCDTQGSRQQQQQQPPQTPTSSVNPSRIVSKVPVTQIPPPPMVSIFVRHCFESVSYSVMKVLKKRLL